MFDLDELRSAGLWRRRTAIERRLPGRVVVDGQEYLDFASNDYLGLAGDPRVIAAARRFLEANAFGGGAAPLITGYHVEAQSLERELADFEGVEAVLTFASGFVANATVLPALADRADAIFCEKRNHASLVAGCRLSRAKLHIYRGDQLDKLSERLSRATGYRRRLIVTDSVFSMDGDLAPLADLCDLADRFEAIVYVDEAHATGVLGPTGRGAAEAASIEHRLPIRMGTLSKALGSVGGFVAGKQEWIDWLLHQASGYVYSTALPPVCAAAARAALQIVRGEPQRRQTVLQLADRLRSRLHSAGIPTGGSCTAIVPIVVGGAQLALDLAERLRSLGFWTVAIRPPTVSAGASRLRLSLSAAHLPDDIDRLAHALNQAISRQAR